MRQATFHSLTELTLNSDELAAAKVATANFLAEVAEPRAGFVMVQVLLSDNQTQLFLDITWESRAVFDDFERQLANAPTYAKLAPYRPRTLALNAIEL